MCMYSFITDLYNHQFHNVTNSFAFILVVRWLGSLFFDSAVPLWLTSEGCAILKNIIQNNHYIYITQFKFTCLKSIIHNIKHTKYYSPSLIYVCKPECQTGPSLAIRGNSGKIITARNMNNIGKAVGIQ
jgi:hypothetical protein